MTLRRSRKDFGKTLRKLQQARGVKSCEGPAEAVVGDVCASGRRDFGRQRVPGGAWGIEGLGVPAQVRG